jgi:hypothetical protein
MRANRVFGQAKAKRKLPDRVNASLEKVYDLCPAAAKTGSFWARRGCRLRRHFRKASRNNLLINNNSFDYSRAWFTMGGQDANA